MASERRYDIDWVRVIGMLLDEGLIPRFRPLRILFGRRAG
jgi:hypothetical protein